MEEKVYCKISLMIRLSASIVSGVLLYKITPVTNLETDMCPCFFVFIMYLINRSASVTQAMFMNCDHSMLTYRIYRTPKVILGIFKERLKTLILINLLPALLISLGLAMTLYLSGGTDNPVNYLVIIVSIISMSIFF